MLSESAKYIYIKDCMGELLGSVAPPFSIDCVFLKIIAVKSVGDTEWDKDTRGTDLAVRLKGYKGYVWRLYDDYQEFCEEFFDAIL